jgi:hypothetical protein
MYQSMVDAAKYAQQRGVVIVVAAGRTSYFGHGLVDALTAARS